MNKIAKLASKAENRKFLVQHGMRESLVSKLNDDQVKDLVSFAMDHIKASNLSQMLIQLASMELRDKIGALQLAVLEIGTVLQLKNLSSGQIHKLLEELESNKDENVVRRELKAMLIQSQQEKLYFKSGGVKGGYQLHNKPEEWLEKV